MPKKKGDSRTNEQLKQLTLRIPSELHLRLKLKCVQEGRPMGDVLTELIEKYVDKT
jgi:predicted DNA-binding protein